MPGFSLELLGYEVEYLGNSEFHLQAIRKKEVRRIVVMINPPTNDYEMIVRKIGLPPNFTKEIFIRKNRGFEIKEIQ